jgi:N-acetylglucosamine kinase-like BadF-type ATPase
MVDLKATNTKLRARANRIVRTLVGLDADAADELLVRCGWEVKTAIAAHLCGISADEARAKLKAAGGRVVGVVGPRLKPPPDPVPHRPDLVIGIDGGGSHTLALLADAATGRVIGRGSAGPSNIQAVGPDAGLRELGAAVDGAFAAAGLPRSRAGAICLGLAGVGRPDGLDLIRGWAERAGLADAVTVTTDAALLLAAGTPDGWGLAVIAGTGSIAVARSASGEIGRAGGWGYLLGDEGSAFRVVQSALRACCHAVDGCGPPTGLVERFAVRMGLSDPRDFVSAVYGGGWDRAALASLAPLVLEAAAGGDLEAVRVLTEQAEELARTAAAAARTTGLPASDVPLALAGGLMLGSETYRELFLVALRYVGLSPGPVRLVDDPAVGAVLLARKRIV